MSAWVRGRVSKGTPQALPDGCAEPGGAGGKGRRGQVLPLQKLLCPEKKRKRKRGRRRGLHSDPSAQSHHLAPCRGRAARSLVSTLARTSPAKGFRSGHSGARVFLSLAALPTPPPLRLDPELRHLGYPSQLYRWPHLSHATLVFTAGFIASGTQRDGLEVF